MRFLPQFDPDLNPNWGHILGSYCENDICWKSTIYKVKVLYNFVGEKGTYRANGKANVVFFVH